LEHGGLLGQQQVLVLAWGVKQRPRTCWQALEGTWSVAYCSSACQFVLTAVDVEA
jgi:hypothetical protein